MIFSMTTRSVNLSLLALSLAGFAAGYYLLKIYSCGYSVDCYNLTTAAFALYYSMPALALVFLALAVFPATFNAWKKFGVWFIPLAALFFIFYSGPASGDLFSPYPETVYKWVSIIYVVISLGIIGWEARNDLLGRRGGGDVVR